MLRLRERAGHRADGEGRRVESDESELVQRVFPGVGQCGGLECSAPLDKSRTMSDWNQRPLDAKELYYAALDAYATRAIAVECMKMILERTDAIRIKDRLKVFKNEKWRQMEQKSGESEEDFEKRKENALRDLIRFGIVANAADQSKYRKICSVYEL